MRLDECDNDEIDFTFTKFASREYKRGSRSPHLASRNGGPGAVGTIVGPYMIFRNFFRNIDGPARFAHSGIFPGI